MVQDDMLLKFSTWWDELKRDNGRKAQLRRCSSPDEAAILPGTYYLKRTLPKWVPLELVATIAGLSAHIKENREMRFIESLATPKEKSGRVPFSESRFRQLLSCRDWDELYRNLRRAIIILDNSVNYESFVKTVFLWNDEFRGAHTRPGKSTKFQLSREYYETVMNLRDK